MSEFSSWLASSLSSINLALSCVHRVRSDEPDLVRAFGDHERQQPGRVGLSEAQSADFALSLLDLDYHWPVRIGFLALLRSDYVLSYMRHIFRIPIEFHSH